MVAKRKTVIYPKKPTIAGAKAELKPLIYLAAIGVPFMIIMWALRKERQ